MTKIFYHSKLDASYFFFENIFDYIYDSHALATFIKIQMEKSIDHLYYKINLLVMNIKNKVLKTIQLLRKTSGWQHIF